MNIREIIAMSFNIFKQFYICNLDGAIVNVGGRMACDERNPIFI